jgi:hypothetical protein
MNTTQETFIRENYQTTTDSEISTYLKVKPKSVKDFRERNGLLKDPTIVRQLQADKEVKKQKERAQEQIAALTDENYMIQEQLNLALALEKNLKPRSITNVPSTSSKDESVAFVIASDWHYEEMVRSSETNGLNEFNLKTADARITSFFRNAVKMLQKEQKDATIKTLVLALLGDFITNSNLHDDTPEFCQLGVFEALSAVENHIIGGIDYILDNTDVNLVIPCSVGNHSRVTKKIHITRETSNSLETILYAHIARYYKDNKRVQFNLPTAYLSYLTLWDKFTVCFHHGHAVSYGGGIGGITVPMNKAIGNWERNKKADLYVSGHFHTATDGGKFLVNSSLIGYNGYAVFIKASYEPASQWFFLVNKKHNRKTITAPIFLS